LYVSLERKPPHPASLTDSARQLLDKLTELAGKEREERERLEGGSTEAEYRELGEQDGS
jgi:hypothetical protein